MAVDKVAEKAREPRCAEAARARGACAREALGPVLDSTALLGNTLALIGDAKGALAAYERVLQIQPRNAAALYGHGAVTFDLKGDDVAALKAARKELQTSADLAPGTSQGSSAKALAERIDKVIAAGGATKFARQQEKVARRGKAGRRRRADGRWPMAAPPPQAAPAAPAAGGAGLAAPAQQGDDGGVREDGGDARRCRQTSPGSSTTARRSSSPTSTRTRSTTTAR